MEGADIIPLTTNYEQDFLVFWGLTAFAIVWWGFQVIKLPGTFNELQARIGDLGKGQSFLPLVMQLFFLIVWWVIPLIPIIAFQTPYFRYFHYFTRTYL